MKKLILFAVILFAMFIAVGCSDENGDGDPCTCDTLYIVDTLYDTLIVVDTIVICDTNYTDLDPPFIKDVSGPGSVVEGNSAAFSCSIYTDAPIVSYRWDFLATSDGFEDYFYPAGLANGTFTPSGTAPSPFQHEATGYTASYTYDNRGRYTAILEIEDEDGYIEYGGTRVAVDPSTPDTPGPDFIVRVGMPESLYVENFDYKRHAVIADHRIPASVYHDDSDDFKAFAHVSDEYLSGQRYIQTRAELGRVVQLEAFGDYICELTWDIDIQGALHYWGSNADDVVMYSIYSTMKMDTGLPQTRCIYRKALDGSSGDQAYFINENISVTDSVLVWGMHEYEVWLGIETVQLLSPGAGSAVSFDGDDGFTKLNKLLLYMDK
ncbi:MAG TPA: hypothetical protein ENN75_03775 [candidate division Zixibacteria bacterium]|nr:hypothetical protein [candidate division Zixibacteria bacterium]